MHLLTGPEIRESAAVVFIPDLWPRARLPEDVTACMNAVVAFVVGVALVAVVEVVGDIGVVVASAFAAVVVPLVGPDCFLLLSCLRSEIPPPRFLH